MPETLAKRKKILIDINKKTLNKVRRAKSANKQIRHKKTKSAEFKHKNSI